MPNHIVNHLKINGTIEQVNQVLEFLKGENGIVDFNKIKPMPDCLNIEECSDGKIGMGYLLYKRAPKRNSNYKSDYELVQSWGEARKKDAIELGKQYLDNIARYGHDTWYNWRLVNWGTKWNAYECLMTDENTVEFQTAWSGVPNLMSDVVAMFPNIDFEYLYADEDCGYNVGCGFSCDGELIMEYPDGGTEEAYDIYFKTHPWAKDEMEFKDGEWRWKDL